MKKTIISFLIFALSITLAFLLTACAGKECNHAYVRETIVPTCTENGFDKFSCTKCDHYFTMQINATGHSPEAAVKENRVDATCTVDGHYDSVVYCGKCYDELSRNTVTLTAPGHSPNAAVEENRVEAACPAKGHYDSVVYCGKCDDELSRETVNISASIHNHVNNICTGCGEVVSSDGLEYTLNPDEKSYTVTSIGGFTGNELFIGLYNGLPVTSIGNEAFYDCTGLTSATIGNGVTSIGDFAFYYCYNLASIKYRGTEEQWNAITKGILWDDNTVEDYTITYNYTGK